MMEVVLSAVSIVALVLGLVLAVWSIDRGWHANHDEWSSCACARQGRHGHKPPPEEGF